MGLNRGGWHAVKSMVQHINHKFAKFQFAKVLTSEICASQRYSATNVACGHLWDVQRWRVIEVVPAYVDFATTGKGNIDTAFTFRVDKANSRQCVLYCALNRINYEKTNTISLKFEFYTTMVNH